MAVSSSDDDYFRPPLVRPAPPSFARYQRLARSPNSLTRELVYERLEQVDLLGSVLDIGGGAAADYADLLPPTCEVVSVNLAPAMRPSVLADLRDPLPFADESFDTVISLNTLEHVADDQAVVGEAWRLLRPGGSLHIFVPFLFRDHPSPDDFHRHTAQGWEHVLSSAGIPREAQLVEPLCWDPLTTAFAIADVAPIGRLWWRFRRHARRLVLKRPLLLERWGRWQHDDRAAAEHALDFYIMASKPPETGSVPCPIERA